MTLNGSRVFCCLTLLATAVACGSNPSESTVSGTAGGALTVGGYSCPQSGTIAVSTIPANNQYYMTTFGGQPGDDGTMSCGGPANGTSLYIADRQRFGCNTHVRITNPANGKSCVAYVGDTGPNICVEEAAGKPVIDASPAIAEYIFNASSEGWSGHAAITAVVTTDPIGCGNAPMCVNDTTCNGGKTGTQKVCSNSGTCITGCHVDTDCPTGDYCDTSLTTYACKPSGTPTGGGSGGSSGSGGGSSGSGGGSSGSGGGSAGSGGGHAGGSGGGSAGGSGGGSGGSSGALGSSCTSDTDCNHGATESQEVCSNSGICIRGCHSDGDCPPLDYCDMSLSTWECEPSATSGGGSGGGTAGGSGGGTAGGSGGGSGGGTAGGSGGGAGQSCTCTCDNNVCAIDAHGDCADGTNCLGLTNFCSVCTCGNGTCPLDGDGNCNDGTICNTGNACAGTCLCDDGNCANDSSGVCSDGYNCKYKNYCELCICPDNTCATNATGACSDGSNCLVGTGNVCMNVCTCDDHSCAYDAAGDCHDGFNCMRENGDGDYCNVCKCDNGSCPINTEGTCTDGTNCFYSGSAH